MVTYENPAGLQINAFKDYTYYVFVIEDNEYIRLFTYGHLGDGTWWQGPRFNPKLGKLGGPGVFQNRAKDKTIEIIVPTSLGTYQHFSLDANILQWKKGKSFGKVGPSGTYDRIAVFQNNAPNNFNYEVIAREGDHLQHYWYDYSADIWNMGQKFGKPVAGPAAFQNHSPDNYNYEVFVDEGYHLRNYWYGHLSDGKWHQGLNFARGGSLDFLSPAAFQNQNDNNYHYQVFFYYGGTKVSHYTYKHLTDGSWYYNVNPDYNYSHYGLDVRSPTAFQNRSPNNNNYELIFPVSDKTGSQWHLEHYWYDYVQKKWNRGQSFG